LPPREATSRSSSRPQRAKPPLARPPREAISRWRFGSIAANPRGRALPLAPPLERFCPLLLLVRDWVRVRLRVFDPARGLRPEEPRGLVLLVVERARDRPLEERDFAMMSKLSGFSCRRALAPPGCSADETTTDNTLALRSPSGAALPARPVARRMSRLPRAAHRQRNSHAQAGCFSRGVRCR
jgi:hypothetical protein